MSLPGDPGAVSLTKAAIQTVTQGRKLFKYLKSPSFDEEAEDILEELPFE